MASELKRLYPQAEIDFLVKKGNESLLTGHPSIRTVKTFDKKQGKLKSMIHIIRENRRMNYDLVVNLHRFASSGIITVLSGANQTRGFAKNPFSIFYSKKYKHTIGDGTHEVSRNLQLINDLGAELIARPSLYPSEKDKTKVNQLSAATYFCLAPASVWFTKQLPVDKWIELGNSLIKKGNVYLLGAATDFDLCATIQSQLKKGDYIVENLAGKLNLLESAALMEKATRNFVNDSGPLHISSAMNAPTTAFFCSTTPTFGFGPLADDSNILESTLQLDCKPCGLHGYSTCPQGHFQCGKSITISEVL